MAKSIGKVVQVLGGVVDCEFPDEQLPNLFDAIEVPRPNAEPLTLEVQKHLPQPDLTVLLDVEALEDRSVIPFRIDCRSRK